MKARRTALSVLVPEAEPAVSQLREQLDPVARLGVPAHVSAPVPFVPAANIDEAVVARTAALFRSVPGFRHNLVRTAWFGDEVLWVAPRNCRSDHLDVGRIGISHSANSTGDPGVFVTGEFAAGGALRSATRRERSCSRQRRTSRSRCATLGPR